MSCRMCRNGILEEGQTTLVLERGETTLVFRNVPARLCDNCGEAFVSAEVNADLLRQGNQALERGVTLELLRYAA